MKQQEVFKKIGGIFHELIEQYESFRASADHLNELELEIFIANIHFLKDHADILRRLNAQNIHAQLQLPAPDDVSLAKEEVKFNEPRYFEPVLQQIKSVESPAFNHENAIPAQKEAVSSNTSHHEAEKSSSGIDLGSDTANDSYSYVREEEDTIRHELILDEADTWDDEDENVAEHADETPTIQDKLAGDIKVEPVSTAPQPSIPTLSIYADLPDARQEEAKEQTLTLNEKLSARLKEQNAASAIPVQPLPDIKAAINLNDKMLFVKELFNGYTLAYTEAVDIANRFNSFEEADRFLQKNYAVKNNWEAKKSTSDKFYALLRRRYA